MKEILNEWNKFLNEIEIEKDNSDLIKPKKYSKENKVDLDAHRQIMDKYIQIMSPTTSLVDPKKQKKLSTKNRCGFWGPLVDLTATAEKAKKAGFFSTQTDDIGKLWAKVNNHVASDENGRHPAGFVVLDRGDFSKSRSRMPGTIIDNLKGGKELEDIKKDMEKAADCPPNHKCVRKCIQTVKIPEGKITYDMIDYTAAPQQILDVQGNLVGLSYAPGTKYATTNFAEVIDQNLLQNNPGLIDLFKNAANASESKFGHTIFAGVYSPKGGKSAQKSEGYKGYNTAIQFFASEGFSNGKPSGQVYPAYFNVLDDKIIFTPDFNNKIDW